MGPENKDPHREDVFDSLQGASSLTFIKKIAIAAIAIGLVAFFLFWSQSSDDKSPSKEGSTATLQERVAALEEDVTKIKEVLKMGPAQPIDQATKTLTATAQETPTQTPAQPDSINLKSLFEEELKSSSTPATTPEETSAPNETKEVQNQKPADTKPIAKPAKGSKTVVYVVKKGDTLSKISLKFYGSSHKWQRIVDANKSVLGNNNTLKVGMKLNIPVAE